MGLYIYSRLPNTYAGMGGYAGKDLNPFKMLLEIHEIPKDSYRLVLDIVQWLDNRAIEKSVAETKRAAKK